MSIVIGNFRASKVDKRRKMRKMLKIKRGAVLALALKKQAVRFYEKFANCDFDHKILSILSRQLLLSLQRFSFYIEDFL